MKKFHISDILTVTTGKMLSTRNMEGLYEILNYMTGDNLYTHQLSRALKECKPYLLEQHQELERVTGEGVTTLNLLAWIKESEKLFGEYLEVKKIPKEAHELIDPIAELIIMQSAKE